MQLKMKGKLKPTDHTVKKSYRIILRTETKNNDIKKQMFQ